MEISIFLETRRRQVSNLLTPVRSRRSKLQRMLASTYRHPLKGRILHLHWFLFYSFLVVDVVFEVRVRTCDACVVSAAAEYVVDPG